MTTSQFTVYSASDMGAPQLNGLSGSLIDVLNGCLYTGYGTKQPLGWLKPIPDDATQDLACYQQPSGSGLVLFINDAGALSGSNSWTQEAWACGYESILGLTGSFFSGTGYGQFPYASQTGLATGTSTGSVIWRKSNTRTAIARDWILFGDSRTFYLFISHSGTGYSFYAFGDIFSFKSTHDAYKCLIAGRLQPNTTGDSISIDHSDYVFQPDFNTYPDFIARPAGGMGRCIRATKNGDAGKCNLAAGTQYVLMAGVLTGPNPLDGAIYMSPVSVGEPDSSSLRGRWRGLWFPTHPITNFAHGQVFSGTGELSGKTFMIVSPGVNNGHWAIEISNTVETNDE
jgi:hypothetical protein